MTPYKFTTCDFRFWINISRSLTYYSQSSHNRQQANCSGCLGRLRIWICLKDVLMTNCQTHRVQCKRLNWERSTRSVHIDKKGSFAAIRTITSRSASAGSKLQMNLFFENMDSWKLEIPCFLNQWPSITHFQTHEHNDLLWAQNLLTKTNLNCSNHIASNWSVPL